MRRIIWALFGNDEDTIYGPPWFNKNKLTRWTAVRWWFRNPFHNLVFHVMVWPGGPIFRWGKVPGWNGYIGFREGGVFGIAIRKETKN